MIIFGILWLYSQYCTHLLIVVSLIVAVTQSLLDIHIDKPLGLGHARAKQYA
jgi:hypothetical protein